MRLTISMKIIFSISILLLIALFMGGYSTYVNIKSLTNSEYIKNVYVPTNEYNSDLVAKGLKYIRCVQVYLYTGIESVYEEGQVLHVETTNALEKLKNHVRSNSELLPIAAKTLEESLPSVEEYMAIAKSNMNLMHDSQKTEVEFIKATSEFISYGEEIMLATNNVLKQRISAGNTAEIEKSLDNQILVSSIMNKMRDMLATYVSGIKGNDVKQMVAAEKKSG